MNENNKFFYPSDMFEFIHHPEYGCLKGLSQLTFFTEDPREMFFMNSYKSHGKWSFLFNIKNQGFCWSLVGFDN
jgi:hypothetical protein